MEGVEYLKTYGWRAAHIVFENAKLRNENQVKKTGLLGNVSYYDNISRV